MRNGNRKIIYKDRLQAKIIISGEHAVVFGKPALACSIDNYFNFNAAYNYADDFVMQVVSSSEGISFSYNLAQIEAIYHRISNALSMSEFCLPPSPEDLLCYSIFLFIEQHHTKPQGYLSLKLNSEVLSSRGLGSSALAIMSVLKALQYFFPLNDENNVLYEIGRRAEDLQHGKSSGVDIRMSLNPGVYYFTGANRFLLDIEMPHYYLIDTGASLSPTAECVAASTAAFAASDNLLHLFAENTARHKLSLINKDYNSWHQAIKTNHALLKQINVVPEKVVSFIADLEVNNFAAKTCGSGSCRGNSAGMVLVHPAENASISKLKQIISSYGYNIYLSPKLKLGVANYA